MDDTVTINVRLGAEMIGEQSFPLETEISVGRSSDSSIVLDSRGVSRKHAIMVASKSGVSVRNLSPNGILLGAKPSGNHFEAPFGAEIGIAPFTLVPRRADTDGPNQDRPALRRRVLRGLIEHIDLGSVDAKGEELRPRVEAALERLLHREGIPVGDGIKILDDNGQCVHVHFAEASFCGVPDTAFTGKFSTLAEFHQARWARHYFPLCL